MAYHFPNFEFGEVEEVVCEVKQILAACVNDREVFFLFFVDAAVFQESCHARNPS